MAAGTRSLPKTVLEREKPADWTPEQIKTLLTDSPWSKRASVSYYGGQNGPLGTLRPKKNNRRNSPAVNATTPTTGGASSVRWEAIVRWESATPIREAMKAGPNPDLADNYILNMVGDIPTIGATDDDPSARESAFEMWKAYTKLEHQGDPLTLNKVELAPKTALSPAGTLFYFSRVLPLKPEDKQATFSTKMGPIEVKCKFSLKEMVYHGRWTFKS